MPDEWVEVNIMTSSQEQRGGLLLDVVEPLVRDKLEGMTEAWFYFWEPDLRLRIRWPSEHADDGHRELKAFLDTAQTGGMLASWYEGNHGKRGEVYQGEAEDYGAEAWEITYKDWMSGSDLAIALLRHAAEGELTKALDFHWSRRVHLFSNQLGLSYFDEGQLCMGQAQAISTWRNQTVIRSPMILRFLP